MNTDTMDPNSSLTARRQDAPTIFGKWMGWLRAFAEERGRQQARLAMLRHDIRIVGGFTDQQLRDIGLDRSEILGVVMHGKQPAREAAAV